MGPFSAHLCRILLGRLAELQLITQRRLPFSPLKFLCILPKTLARTQRARHCLAMLKSKGERERFVCEPFASQDAPAGSHSCSPGLGMDRLLLVESSVPKLVVAFAARWDGLDATGARQRPSVGTRESPTALQQRVTDVRD